MKKKINFAILAALFVIVGAIKADAGSILFVSPTRIELDKTARVAVVNVTNQSDITRAYNLVMKDFKMTEAGVTTQAEDDFKYSLKKYLRFMPRRVVLAPGERQTVRVMIRPDAQMEDGAYHTHLRFVEDIKVMTDSIKNVPKAGASVSARMAYAAAIPVFYDHGNVEVKYGMENVKLIKNKDGKPAIKFDALRSGNGQGRSFVRVFYKSPTADEVQLGEAITTALYREVDVIHRESDLTLPKEVTLNPSGKLIIRMYDSNNSTGNLIKDVELPAAF